MNTSNQQCPCLSGKEYQQCCGLYLATDAPAPTPEALMRSRYTAYTQNNIDYIGRTMRDAAAQDFDPEVTLRWAQRVKWLSLNVLHSETQGEAGHVEFKARYLVDHKEEVIHEISEFKLIDGRWFYVDGEQGEEDTDFAGSKKIGRNDPCPCGSSKKYKKCCGA